MHKFVHDDDGYLRWLTTHTGGFIVNTYRNPRPAYLRLQRVGTGTEVTGGSYARVAVASGVGNWAAPSAGNGTTSNVNIIAFPTPTVTWLTVTHFGLYDAASAGNLLPLSGGPC